MIGVAWGGQKYTFHVVLVFVRSLALFVVLGVMGVGFERGSESMIRDSAYMEPHREDCFCLMQNTNANPNFSTIHRLQKRVQCALPVSLLSPDKYAAGNAALTLY